MPYFNFCNRCRMTFSNEADYIAHQQSHGPGTKAAEERVVDKLKKRSDLLPPGDMDEDKRLAEVQEINTKKKKLINAGIEAATMSPKEVNARYAAEFGKEKENEK